MDIQSLHLCAVGPRTEDPGGFPGPLDEVRCEVPVAPTSKIFAQNSERFVPTTRKEESLRPQDGTGCLSSFHKPRLGRDPT